MYFLTSKSFFFSINSECVGFQTTTMQYQGGGKYWNDHMILSYP